ncbi:MAG: tetratricopeptide repeat protein [Proteobacteria bacterium]|nr:tetratricopeptide repeat protein [Pseudomonadota bacterium]
MRRFWKRRLRVDGDADRDRLHRALLAVLERDFDTAEAALQEAVEADSMEVEPYLALARVYRTRGELGRAIRIHQNLLLRRELTSAHRGAVLEGLARDFQQGGFLRRAIAAYEELLALEPRHAGALRALASLAEEAREHERALELTRRLARAEGEPLKEVEARLWVRAAEAAHAAGDHPKARKSIKRALRADPRQVDARLLLGRLEAERGKNKAALAAWEAIPRLDRARAVEVYPRLESSYAALDRPRDFEKLLRALIEEDPEDPHARLALANHLGRRGETQMAIDELRRLLGRHPSWVPGRVALGRRLLSEHRELEAVKEFGELLAVLEDATPGLGPGGAS